MSVHRNYKFTDVEILSESEKALYIQHQEHGTSWFPKSHAMVTSKGVLWCSEWIAEQKGWKMSPDPGDQFGDHDDRDLGRKF